MNPDSSLAIGVLKNQWVVGRVLTRPLRQAQDRHVGLKPDLRPNGLSGMKQKIPKAIYSKDCSPLGVGAPKKKPFTRKGSDYLAEREGFEPSIQV